MIQSKPRFCPYCDGRNIIKKGLRKNSNRQLQIYRCKDCFKYFTHLSGITTKYSPTIIARALLLFYQGHTQAEIAKIFKSKYKVCPSLHTVSRWIKKYRRVCTFYPFRSQALKKYTPQSLVTKVPLEHLQTYIFEMHSAKLIHLRPTLGRNNGEKLSTYLDTIAKSDYPHALFRDNTSTEEYTTSQETLRSSQSSFETLPFVTRVKQNTANDLATFGLYLASRAVERHPMIETFMLYCDRATVAIEVPLYLTNVEVNYFKDIGFYLPLKKIVQPITGHIDILQIRNGHIHILDYKPEAKKTNPVNQLLLYSLALASRTKLPLKMFTCAWFDEKDYFEFYPLQAVHQKKELARNYKFTREYKI